MSDMEKEFKGRFIATFLAAWCAKHFEDYCINSKHEELRHPPVEDAVHLADEAWRELRELTDALQGA